MMIRDSIWFKERKVLLLGYVLYAVSLALPSLTTPAVFSQSDALHYGAECLWAVYLVTFGFLQILDFLKFDKETFIAIYAFANSAFLISPFILRSQSRRVITGLLAVLIFFSLFVVAAPYLMNVVAEANYQFLIGYYFWLGAFLFNSVGVYLRQRAL